MLRAVALDFDDALRAQAFAYLDGVTAVSGGITRRGELEAFTFEGRRIPLLSRQQGIWKPAVLDSALSILTTYVAPNETPPYYDHEGLDGYPRYKWRGTDPRAWDNVALRRAMELG